MTSLPFKSNFFEAGRGIRMHYLDEGSGPPVVMLHGNPTWSYMYREVVKALAPKYRCIVPDHVGMGLSDKPADTRYSYTLSRRTEDLDRLLDHLKVEGDVTLVCHDWGGMIGMAWAVRHPEKIRRIVVMNTAAFFPPPTKPLPPSLKWARGPLGALLVRGFNAFSRGAVRYCAVRKPLAPEVRDAFLAPYGSWADRIAVHRFVQDIPIQRGDPAYDVVEETQTGLWRLSNVPMLVLWGGRDFVFDLEFYREWQRRFPRAEFRLIPDAGHFVLEDAPEAVEAVRDFVTAKMEKVTP